MRSGSTAEGRTESVWRISPHFCRTSCQAHRHTLRVPACSRPLEARPTSAIASTSRVRIRNVGETDDAASVALADPRPPQSRGRRPRPGRRSGSVPASRTSKSHARRSSEGRHRRSRARSADPAERSVNRSLGSRSVSPDRRSPSRRTTPAVRRSDDDCTQPILAGAPRTGRKPASRLDFPSEHWRRGVVG